MPAARTRGRLRRAGVIALVSVLVLVGAAYGGAALLRVPPPHQLVRIALDEPSTQGSLYPAGSIPASTDPRPLPVAASPRMPDTVPWKGEDIPVEEFLTLTHSNAFLVLRDGEIHEDWYAPGRDAETRMSSWSVAKSIVSLLVGQAIGDGLLSEDDRLVDVLPELRTGDGYDEVTIGELLDMTSGVDVDENYDPNWPFTGTARMYLTTDLAGFVADHRGLRFPPGSRGEYRSVDTQLLGMAVARVRGASLSELLGSGLWEPLGAESSAFWNLDHDGGQEKAFCCVNATAHDFARLGQLVLDRGAADGRQLVPEAWIDRILTPAPLPVDGEGYAAQWWHWEGSTGDVSAIGIYGQYIFVDPATRTVIVKLSDHGTEQDETETIEAMRAIAAF